MLAAGEWPEEDLGTWRREAATAPGVGRQRRPPSRRREREGGGAEGESEHAGGRKRNVRGSQGLQLKLQLQHASVEADRGPCRRCRAILDGARGEKKITPFLLNYIYKSF